MKTQNIYLAYYRKEVAVEIQNFKNGNFESINNWLNTIDGNFDKFFDLPKIDYVVRALGSDETTVKCEKPLDKVGKLLAKKLNAQYVPEILSKSKTRKLRNAGDRDKRKKILHNTYSCNLAKCGVSHNSSILLIDDVSTTGTTFEEMTRAILEDSLGCNISYFSLVKTLLYKDITVNRERYNKQFYNNNFAA